MFGKLFLSLILIIALPFAKVLGQQPTQNTTLSKQKIAGLITALVPENFTLLSEGELAQNYPSTNRPVAVYSNLNRNADLGFNKGRTVWLEKDIQMVLDFYKANVQYLYTKVNFYKAEVEKINGKNIARLEFTGEVTEKGKQPLRKYVNIAYAVVDNRLYVVQFNCNDKEKMLYEEMSNKIIKSLKFKREKGDTEQIPEKKNKKPSGKFTTY